MLCELEVLPEFKVAKHAHGLASSVKEEGSKEDAKKPGESRRLLLQGQLRYLEDWNAIIFLCNPLSVKLL